MLLTIIRSCRQEPAREASSTIYDWFKEQSDLAFSGTQLHSACRWCQRILSLCIELFLRYSTFDDPGLTILKLKIVLRTPPTLPT